VKAALAVRDALNVVVDDDRALPPTKSRDMSLHDDPRHHLQVRPTALSRMSGLRVVAAGGSGRNEEDRPAE
jgi:hypothetical protein